MRIVAIGFQRVHGRARLALTRIHVVMPVRVRARLRLAIRRVILPHDYQTCEAVAPNFHS